jgi:hypothetical protein
MAVCSAFFVWARASWASALLGLILGGSVSAWLVLSTSIKLHWYEICHWSHATVGYLTVSLAVLARFDVFWPCLITWGVLGLDRLYQSLFMTCPMLIDLNASECVRSPRSVLAHPGVLCLPRTSDRLLPACLCIQVCVHEGQAALQAAAGAARNQLRLRRLLSPRPVGLHPAPCHAGSVGLEHVARRQPRLAPFLAGRSGVEHARVADRRAPAGGQPARPTVPTSPRFYCTPHFPLAQYLPFL